MTREQFKWLIGMAEAQTQRSGFGSPRLPGLCNYFLDEGALAAAKEELAKWPTEDEIDETPRIPLSP